MTLVRCRECGREVSDTATECPHCGAKLQSGSQRRDGEPMPESYLIWGIVTTVCCCLPFGIVSIIYASKVEDYWRQGLQDMAYEAAAKAKKFAIIGAVAAPLVGIILFIVASMIIGDMGIIQEILEDIND